MDEALLNKFGFESEEEFNRMVSNVDLSDLNKIIDFKHWQKNDGTKAGLEKLIKN